MIGQWLVNASASKKTTRNLQTPAMLAAGSNEDGVEDSPIWRFRVT